jgi:AI-2 transport protein TqsA
MGELRGKDRMVKTAAVLLVIGFIVAILQYFRTFLQPLIVALILWFIVSEVRSLLSKIKFGRRRLPRPVLTLISTVSVFFIFYVITDLIIINFQSLIENADRYNTALVNLLEEIEDILGVENLGEAVAGQQTAIVTGASTAARALASFVGRMFLVLFYLLFLLLEEAALSNKMKKIYARSGSRRSIKNSITRISNLLSAYLGIKIFTSFLTGFLSYFVLLIIGIDLPMLWAFIIFILNFIPSVGSIVATSFPVLFAMLQYAGEWGKALSVLLGVLAVQVSVGNLLEPRILGNRLNLSPLVVILGLTFWGFVWGFVGMLLSVPIMATLMIIFSQFEDTRSTAILFSKDGNIEYLFEDEKSATADK